MINILHAKFCVNQPFLIKFVTFYDLDHVDLSRFRVSMCKSSKFFKSKLLNLSFLVKNGRWTAYGRVFCYGTSARKS